MKLKLVILFAFVASALDAQIGLRPDFFIEQTNPTNANTELYSQKGGLVRRISLNNLKRPLSPFITDTIDYIPADTGNVANLASFVWDTTGLLWYIDGEGDAVSFDGGAGGGAVSDGDYGDITVSGTGTVWNIDAGVVGPTELASTAVTPASYTLTGLTVDADGRLTAASNGTIGSGTVGDMATWAGANTLTSQTDTKFIYDNNLTYGQGLTGGITKWLNDSTLTTETAAHFIWNNNLAYGQGLAGTMAYWVNDTTLANSAITYSATQWNASTLTGSLRLATGTTAQRPSPVNGDLRYNTSLGDMEFYTNQWRSVPEAMAGTFTAGEIGYFNSAGVLTDTTIAALLSIGGSPTGNGVANRVAYWSGVNTLTSHANFLWDGSQLSVGTTNSDYTLELGTGGLRIGGQSAAPTGASGVMYFDSDDNGFWGYNGTTFQAMVRGDAPSWTTAYVPYSSGSTLTANAAFKYVSGVSNGSGIVINSATTTAQGLNVKAGGSGDIAQFQTGSTTVLEIESDGDLRLGNTAGYGIEWSTSGQSLTFQNTGLQFDLTNSGGNKSVEFEVSGTGNVACIGGNSIGSGAVTQTGIFAVNTIAGTTSGTTLTVRGADALGAATVGGALVVRGGASSSSNSNGASLTLQGGRLGAAWASNGGIPGDVIIQGFPDPADSLDHIANYNTPTTIAKFKGVTYNIELYELAATTTGTKILTMEVDTVKYRIENIGTISTSTDGSGDVTVTHGMGTTPTAVLVTPTGTTAWIVSVHTIGATTFKVRFFDAAGAAVTSTAVTATWLGKT